MVSKLNGSAAAWGRWALLLLTVVVSVSIGWGQVRGDVTRNTEEIQRFRVDQQRLRDVYHEMDKKIERILTILETERKERSEP